MSEIPLSLKSHRVQLNQATSVLQGTVELSWPKFLWFFGMAGAALVGGMATLRWDAFAVFVLVTGAVLLLGHSLGSHRKLIHNSYQCPKWLENTLVYLGVQVGLAGPLGLMRQHELRDFAQRLPDCHPYLRHGSSFWRDAWWQLCCELHLAHPPEIQIDPRVAKDRFFVWLERTWMLQQLPPALLLYWLGGWAYVYWGVCARVTAGVLGHWLIGYFAHNHGDMNYEVQEAAVQGRNIRWTSLLTMGESWHNNHHAYPGSAKLGLFAGEWDPGWWALVLFQKLGWVWHIRLPEDLPPRQELRTCRLPAGPAVKSSFGLAHLFALCWRASNFHPFPEARMTGPSAHIPAQIMQTLVGNRVHFDHDPSLRRVSLHYGQDRIQGMPALCIAMCTRTGLFKGLALLLLPFAFSWERGRTLVGV
jgi:fatty-acid desaturase